MTAGLLFVLALGLGRLRDRLPEGDLEVLDVDLHPELALEPLGDDGQVGLAHPREHGLVGLVVAAHREGGILVLEAVQAGHELVLVAFGLGADGDGQDRAERGRGLDQHGRALGGEGVAGGGLAQLGHRRDVPRGDLRDRLLLLAPQGEQAVELLVGVGPGVGEHDVGAHGARQDPEQRDLAHVGVGHRLEHVGQRLPARIAGDLLHLVAGPHRNGRPVDGGGPDLADEGGQTVDGDQLGGGPGHHREHGGRRDPVGQRLLQLLGPGDVALQVALHEVVVGHHDALDQVVVDLMLERLHLRRDLALGGLARLIGDGGVGEQVGHAAKRRLLPDGELEGCHARAEHGPQLVQSALERGPLPVQLVDEDHAGQAAGGGHLPHGLRLHLDPLHGADHEHHQVGSGEGGVHLAQEVGVAGAVDDVDLVPFVLERGQGQRHRDLALDLLGVEVGGGAPVLHPALAGDRSGAEQKGLGQGGLPGSAVTHECDVADLGRREGLHAHAPR